MKISLDGDWQLFYAPEAQQRVNSPGQLDASGLAPLPALVPGNVELDLQRAGLLADPFYAANIRALRPLEFCEWWYRRSFRLPAAREQQWQLVFAGLDTLATVWVNGIEVGRSANMLVEQRFDVTQAVHDGQNNEIVVRLGSAINEARRHTYEVAGMSSDHREEALHIRKAPHVWGWDIMPRAVSAGIWRPVWLETRPATALEHVYYWTVAASAQHATLGVHVQFRSDAEALDGFSVRFRAEGAGSFEFEWPLEFIADTCRIEIAQPRLWWPKGYGEPALYNITAQLCRSGQVLDERVDSVGLRVIEVDRTSVAAAPWATPAAQAHPARIDSPPDPAHHFVFRVNDTPIMVTGANWVPLDAFHSRDAGRVDDALALFVDLGCNMIRCWGGNVYEDDHFFDLCDRAGIMVWQDFAFACARYPQDDEFLAAVRREVETTAARLRNHPSLAIWCGDNEVDMIHVHDGLSPERNRLNREIIPQALQRCDPWRHYVPSSPYVPPSLAANRDAVYLPSEQHLWGPRGYYKSPFYTQHSAHFIGEIGYHGCPNASSMRRFISPDHLWPWQENDEWQVHSVYHWQHNVISRDRIKLMANQVQELFGAVPEDMQTFALASQIVQAEAKKFFIESARLRKWHTSGILWWNVIDGWPQFSDAIVDYYFSKKLAYHYIKRVQQPVSIIVGEPGPGKYLPVVVSNNTREDAEATYRVWDAQSGETVAAGTCAAPANQNWQVATIRTFASDQRLYLIEWQTGGRRFGSHYLAGQPPFSLERYASWLPAIAALPDSFDPLAVAR